MNETLPNSTQICAHCEQPSDDALCARCRAEGIRMCTVCGITANQRVIEDDVCERCLERLLANE